MLTILRWIGIVLSALLAVAFTVAAVVYFSPGLQKSLALRVLNEQPGIQTQIGHLRVSFTGLQAGQVFILQGRNGVSVDSVSLSWQLLSSLRERRAVVSRIAVDNLFIDASHWVRNPILLDPGRGLATGGQPDDDDGDLEMDFPSERLPLPGLPSLEQGLQPVPAPALEMLKDLLFGDGLLPFLQSQQIPVTIERMHLTMSLLLPDRQSARGSLALQNFKPGMESVLSLDMQFFDPLMFAGWQHYAVTGTAQIPLNRAHRPEELSLQLTTILGYPAGLPRSVLPINLNGKLRPTATGEVIELQLVLDQAMAPALTSRMAFNRNSRQWAVQAVLAGSPPAAEPKTALPVNLAITLGRTPGDELAIRGTLSGDQLQASAWIEFMQGLLPFVATEPAPTVVAAAPARNGSAASPPDSARPAGGTHAQPVPVQRGSAVALPTAPAPAPFWQGLAGELELFLRAVHWQEWVFNEVRTDLSMRSDRIDSPGGFKFMDASMQWTGSLTFVHGSDHPYRLHGTLEGRNLDGGAILAMQAGPAAKLWEGIFRLDGTAHSQAADIQWLLPNLQGRLHLQSNEGTLRLMGGENTRSNNIQQMLGGIGNLLGGGAGNLTSATDELMRQLREVVYHHMSLEISRGADLHFVLDQLDVRSRDLRFTGNGTVFFDPNIDFQHNQLDLALRLSAKGSLHDRLSALRLTAGMPDDFGYFAGPRFVVGGTLVQPNNNLKEILTQALRNALVPNRGTQ